MAIATLFTTRKIIYISYYITYNEYPIKRKILTYIVTKLTLKDIMLSEITHIEGQDTYCMIPALWGILFLS